MKRLIFILPIAALLALSGCASSAEPKPSEPAQTPATSEPAPAPTPAPERIDFSGDAIQFADLVDVEVRGDEAVILLPSVLGASVVIEGVDATWSVQEKFASGLGGVKVDEWDPGVLVVRPIEGYDAFKDPKDFVRSADGTIHFETSEGRFAVEVEGVEP